MRFVEFLPFVTIRLSPFFYDLPSSGYAFNEQTKIQKMKNTYFDSTSFLDSLQFIHFFFFVLFCYHRETYRGKIGKHERSSIRGK